MIFPSGYTRLDYIESSGTQYIDTLYKFASQNIRVKTTITPKASGNFWWGAGNWDNNITPTVFNNYRCYYSNAYNDAYRFQNDTKYEIDIVKSGSSLTYSVNSQSVLSTTCGNVANGINFYLFKVNTTQSTSQSSYQLFSFKLYDNDVLVRDFYPAKRESDDAIGLLDIVNNVFYENQGTGTFTYGHEIPNNISLEDNPLIKELQDDVSLIANFEKKPNRKKYIIAS